MKRLYIEHNHGGIVLEDVTFTPYGKPEDCCRVAKGTVVDGSSTNRLFHATSTTKEQTGVVKEVDIWNRHVYCFDQAKDYWRVSLVVCG